MKQTKIEWTESTWNPVTGCTKISPGCSHCYAERMSHRLKSMGQPNYANGFRLSMHDHITKLPLSWKTPQMVFVNSMSDLFHKDVPSDFILKIFDVMNQANWHTYQILTKRSGRLRLLSSDISWTNHIWMGVSVESADFLYRVQDLKNTDARIKFLSLEPLLGPIPNLKLNGIDWVIVGGESGPKARPMEASWVSNIRDQCLEANVPFFFKQWGGVNKKKSGRLLDGKIWGQMPKRIPSIERVVA